MKKTGYIKLHRQILDWEFWDDKKASRVFLYILLNANYEDGVFQGHTTVKRGQLLTSLAKLAQGTGYSIKEIRGALSSLTASGEVVVCSTKKFSIISVENYEKYQGEYEGTLTGTQRAQSGAHKGHTEKPESRGDLLDQGAHKGHTDGHTKGTPEGNNIRSKESKNTSSLSAVADGKNIDLENQAVKDWVSSFKTEWNQLAERHGFTKCVSLSETRLKNIKARIKSDICQGRTSEFFRILNEALMAAPFIAQWLDVTKAGQAQTFTRMAEGYYTKIQNMKGHDNVENTQSGAGSVRSGSFSRGAKRSITETHLAIASTLTDD